MNNTEYDNDQNYSIHDKIQQIVEETNVDRVTESKPVMLSQNQHYSLLSLDFLYSG